MKLRTQRIHFMGSSNRDKDMINTEKRNVFQTSYIKSQSCYYKSSQSLPQSENQQQSKTKKPFQGTNVQHQTLRWSSKSKHIGSQTQWKLLEPISKLDYSNKINAEVKDIAEQFKDKDINMYKLNELKNTFIKNNSKRKNLMNYFKQYAKNDKIGVQEMKNVVKNYGYDITDDEAKIMFRLAGQREGNLSIDKFIQLMAKQNVYFKTLRINGLFGKPKQHFQEKIHLVFRNKFPLLKEAFKIYQMRGQEIDFNKFQYVMKKLDINDLVVTKNERNKVFEQFSKDGIFNAQRLLSAIIQQQLIFQPGFPPKLSDYQTNIRAYEQQLYKKNKKTINYDFKRMSLLQYQRQMQKAKQVIQELKKVGEQGIRYLFQKGYLSKDEILEKAEQLLKNKGINLNKQQYDCFTSYLDYNSNHIISSDQYKKILYQKQKQTQERFERRIRAFPPKQTQSNQSSFYDEEIANQSLKKIKHQTFQTQMRQLFKEFDKDKDGYISKSQFRKKINNYGSLQQWEIENLVNYFDAEGKGFMNFNDFAVKYTKGQKQPDNITQPLSKLKSQSQWINTKQSIIKQTNNFSYKIPSKYSAWPQKLKRTDFSMIQPPTKAGLFISQQNRFNVDEKHSLGQQSKLEKNKIYQNKLKKLVAWNEANEKKISNLNQKSQQRAQANDYLMRITKQMYEEKCHK